MTGVEEIVALYDDAGRPSGTAPRSRMRAENLRHAATAVVVRDPRGRVHVHKRTDTKDVYPGRYDFAAGGVLLAGEDPHDAARREAEEELGVTSELVPLGEGDYEDEQTRYHAYLYETTWDGPIRRQAEEVASGEWVTLERLAEMLDDPDVPVMPDTAALLGHWVAARLAEQRSRDGA
jgi:8-oxo-dGTP pyrophosphatase MutT (NUDIX family)